MRYGAIITTCLRPIRLRKALASVCNQTLPPTEILVVDDGKDDRLQQLLEREYPQAHLIPNRGTGISAARNTGIANTQQEWLSFLDDDDEWAATKAEEQANAVAQSKLRLCHTDEIWIRNGKKMNQSAYHTKSGGRIYLSCLRLCCISPSSSLLHRSLFEDYGLFDEELPVCEDYDMWLRIAAYEEILYVAKPLVIKNGGHSDQLSRRYWGMDRFRAQALMKMLHQSQLSAEYRSATREMLRKRLAILRQGACKRGKTEQAKIYEAQLESLR